MKPHDTNASPEHRSFIVVDAEDSSHRLNPGLMALRSALYDIVDDALTRSSIAPRHRVREDRGDGIMMLIEPSVPKIDLVDPLLDHLVVALLRHNQNNAPSGWLRLRVALHAGEVERDDNGWGSADLTLAFRLAGAPAVKKALTAAPRAQCVVVASDWFYNSVIRHGYRSIDPSNYRPVKVRLKSDAARAWVRIPGYAVPPGVPDPAEPSAVALAAALLAARLSEKKISGAAGQAFWTKYAGFLAAVRTRFQHDPAAQAALTTAQRTPDDPESVAALGTALQRHACLDDRFAAELEQIASQARQPGVVTGGITIQAGAIKSVFNEKVTVRGDLNIS